MKEVQAPQPFDWNDGSFHLFLAGSIEMGAAEKWQDVIVDDLSNSDELTILNPRRDDWDSSWVQSINDPQFKKQVEWELKGLDRSHYVAMYFHPDTKSPITLMELGLCAHRGNIVVCCPDGFWRKGNVEVVCDTYKLKLLDSFEDLRKWLSLYK